MTGPSHLHVREGVGPRTVRAVVLLTGASLTRMLREGLVLRSMIWPGFVTCTTLAVTLTVAAVIRPGRDLAVSPQTSADLVQELRESGFAVGMTDDPGAAVGAGRFVLGTDGRTVWVYGTPSAAMELEAIVRTRNAAPWRTVPIPPPEPTGELGRGDIVCRVLALLFVLYGLVFGLGGVARDRDDGTLEAELSLPIPRWAGGLARWVSATLVLSGFYALSVGVFSALIPVPGFVSVVQHGVAACGAGVAVGLAVVGTAGLKQGFSGPFAAGMTSATAIASLGAAMGADWLPIASLFSNGSGVWALCTSGLLGLGSAWLYGRRAGGTA